MIDEASGLEDFAAAERVKALELEVQRLKSEHDFQRSRAAAAERRAAESQRIREHVFNLASAPAVAPEWTLERSQASDAPHVPLLFFSDAQWGEFIDRENMDGTNHFDVETAQRRYRKLIEKTVDIALEHLPRNRYDGIVYLRGGDMVSGDIHDELRETNQLSAVPAVRSLVEAESWGLQQLVAAFGHVHVVSVPGNHGRTTKKPPTKRVSDNYDVLSAWWLERDFRHDPRITFQTSSGLDAQIDVHGRILLATHGDNIGSRGGEGFIGPVATVVRGMKKTMDEYATRGVTVYKMLIGHFHTSLFVGRGWCNGSLPGYSDYARGFRMTPEPPIQWLLFFHPRYGATSQWQLVLEQPASGVAAVTPFSAA